MKRRLFRAATWFRRRPKTVYVVCSSCGRNMGTDEHVAARQQVARQAVESLANVDAVRQRLSSGDRVRDQALANIQANFVQNVVDVAHRQQRLDEPEDHA